MHAQLLRLFVTTCLCMPNYCVSLKQKGGARRGGHPGGRAGGDATGETAGRVLVGFSYACVPSVVSCSSF